MFTKTIDDRLYFKSELLGNLKGVTHCFTSSCGGESHSKIQGLNLGFRVGDDPDCVKANYMHVAKDFGFPFENMVGAKQIHSADIRVVTKDMAGCGISRTEELFECDGLVTDVPMLPLTVFYADCVPILLADKDAGVVAAVHSGWRGTVAKIADAAVKIMIDSFGAKAENIVAAIGPSIGPCCFETGEEVACEFESDLVKSLGNGKFKVDLWMANRRVLEKSGVLPHNIEAFEMCTMCNSDVLYSYRTHQEKTGRMGAFIMKNA